MSSEEKEALVQTLRDRERTSTYPEMIRFLGQQFEGKITLSTAFGLEGQVLLDMTFSHRLPVKVFTLDTGRLFQESHDVYQQTIDKYGQPIKVYFPDGQEVETMVLEKGPNSIYTSVENRQECCRIRKLNPLKRALEGMSVWVSGVRAGQSRNRSKFHSIEWDERHQVLKYYPLLEWSLDKVELYIHENKVPYNKLHDQGFLSIGCAPCTRAVKPGEDMRSGRWWWENFGKECGLHASYFDNIKQS